MTGNVPDNASAGGGRIAELDGFRGFACLLVVLGHYFGEVGHGFRFIRLEWIGVDAFFCLSGLLIGGILIDNRQSPSYFATFYTRRAFRIFPVYYLTVVLVLIALPWCAFAGAAVYPPGIFFGYFQNFAMSWTGIETSKWLMPTWTLCVEEQFYLLLPLLLFVTPPRLVCRALLGLVASASLCRFALVAASANNLALHMLLPSVWDLLLLGVLGAVILRRPGLRAWTERGDRLLLKAAALGGFVMLLVLAAADSALGTRLVDVFGDLALGIGLVGFLLLMVAGAPEGRRFRAPALRFFGRISYALYLIHQPVAGLLHRLVLGGEPDIATPAQIAVTVAAFGLSVALAQLSWVYLEAPLIRLGHHWRFRQAAA